MKTATLIRTGCAAALMALAAPLTAQLPQASATALGMGYNMTASARGFAAVANNPAGLAFWNSPGFSLAIPAVSAGAGVGPIRLQDLVEWEGELVPDAVKEEWLQSVAAAGGQSGIVEAGATPLALNIGPVGFQLSTTLAGDATLGPDAVELLLYGNAGRTGEPRDYDLDGSSVDAFALTTAALSLGIRATDRFYVGVTGKYIMGHGLIVGRDAGTTITADPVAVELEFPFLVNRSEDPEYNNGTGIGVDLGVIYEAPGLTVGATVQNVLNTFEWTLDGLSYIPGTAVFDTEDSEDDFEEQPAEAAPQEFLDVVEELTLKPVMAVGAEFTGFPLLKIQADIRRRTSGGIALGPEFHAGVGVELQALSFLPLRAHGAVITGGMQFGGGASLILGPVNLTAAGALRTGDLEDSTLAMFTLSFGGN